MMNYQNKESAFVDSVRQVHFQTLLCTRLWPCMSGDSKAMHSVVFSVRGLAFCCEYLSVQDHWGPDTKLSLMRGQYLRPGSAGLASWLCYLPALLFWASDWGQVSMGTSEDGIALTSSNYFKDIFKDMTESFHEFLFHNGYKTVS